jgi:SAM-dependent methyltransferase
MDHRQVRGYWNQNAEVWTRLSRAGYDVYRDYFNTPTFFEMLPDVRQLVGLDIGCGEGHNTRLLAKRGARMMAIDASEVFIHYAGLLEEQELLGIDYHVGCAVVLPFPDAAFDFATAFMSLMDIPETARVLAETHRVLKPGGFLQFSITHPCFDTPYRRPLRDERGLTYAVEVADYFRNMQGDVVEWLFSGTPPEVKESVPNFKVPRFTLTLSQWLNLLMETGFSLERFQEPRPDDRVVFECPEVQAAQVVACFLHVRARATP